MPQSKKQRVSAEVPAASAWPHAPSSSSNCIDHIHPALPEAPDPSNGASAPSKRPQLTPTEKLAVLDWYHAHGRNQKAAATHFQRLPRYNKLNQGTISRWLKREEKIRDNSSSPSDSVTAGACRRSAATREKSLKHPELEKCLSRWLEQLDAPQRARLSGREIKSVARQIYDELEVPETDRLELSNGWLGRFQTRHGLKLQRRHGEMLAKEEVDAEGERERLRDEVEKFLAGSDDALPSRRLDDVWSMETTTVFLECSPVQVAGTGRGNGKRTRITVGLAVNATGKERLEPLFVGHEDAALPDFEHYFISRVACMTSSIFWAWAQAWNQTLVESSRHVLLLVSKCCGKKTDQTRLSNIQLRFFPSTLANHLQPCSVGLFRAFHTQYRTLVVHRALNKLRRMKEKVAGADTLFEMGFADAMEVAKAAWQLVGPSPKLLVSCWYHAQILPAVGDSTEVALIEADAYISIAINEQMVTLGQALQALSLEAGSHHVAMSCMGAKEFVLLGLEEGKCNDLSVKELVQLVVGQEDKVQRSGPAKDAPSPLPENNLVEESYPTTQEDNSRKEDTSSSSHIDVSPEVVLHAQLTLEQYWTQKNFSLSPSILQVLQLTRAQLLHTSMAATASSPP